MKLAIELAVAVAMIIWMTGAKCPDPDFCKHVVLLIVLCLCRRYVRHKHYMATPHGLQKSGSDDFAQSSK